MQSINIEYRQGSLNDIDFIIEAITEAEKSGTDSTVYEKLFELSEAEVKLMLKKILEEEVAGSELFCNNFILALDKAKPVGAIAAWVEGIDKKPSNTIKASLLAYTLGGEVWKKAQDKLKLLTSLNIERELGALQIESVYVKPDYRGKRITSNLINFAVSEYKLRDQQLKKVQILSVLENNLSLKAFSNAGFRNCEKIDK